MRLTYILAFLTVLIFIILFLLAKKPRKFYIVYLLLTFPLIDLPITSASLGSFKVFDGISYICFFVLFKDFLFVEKQYRIYFFLFIFLVFSLFLGSLISPFVKFSLISILSVFPVFIYTSCLIKECLTDRKFQNNIVNLLKFAAVFSIIFLCIQLLFGLDFTFYSELNRNTVDVYGTRYPAFFHEPQKFGHFLAMVSFLFLINNSQVEKPRLVNYIVFTIIVLAMVATGGRSSFIGLFVGIFLLFFYLGNRFKAVVISLMIIVITITVNFSSSLLLLKRSQTFNEDLSFRATLWNEAIDILDQHPLLGIGFGNFRNYSILHSDNFWIDSNNEVIFFDQPESGYLMILAEMGILGFLTFCALIMIPIFKSYKEYISNKQNKIKFFYMAGIICWLVSFTSVYSLFDKRILIVVITMVSLLIIDEKVKIKYEI